MPNCYIDHFTYIRSPSGLETASLLGNSGRLSGAHILGATTLIPIANTTVNLAKYDRITIFDGPNSEVVTVTATTNQPAASIPISALAYAHADGTPWCSDGILGSLADELVAASTWAEDICNQALFQATYTNETLRIPSMHGSIDNQNMLIFRPRHFPITAVTSLVIRSNQAASSSYDATQILLDGGQMVVSVPWLTANPGSGGGTYSLLTTVSRQTNLWLQITYTAGYTPASLPSHVRDAVILLASDILSRRQNPTGAEDIHLGDKRMRIGNLRDMSGDSNLVKRAKEILSYYSAEVY